MFQGSLSRSVENWKSSKLFKNSTEQVDCFVAGLSASKLLVSQAVTARCLAPFQHHILISDLQCLVCPICLFGVLVQDCIDLTSLLCLLKACLPQLGYHEGLCHAQLFALSCPDVDLLHIFLGTCCFLVLVWGCFGARKWSGPCYTKRRHLGYQLTIFILFHHQTLREGCHKKNTYG